MLLQEKHNVKAGWKKCGTSNVTKYIIHINIVELTVLSCFF